MLPIRLEMKNFLAYRSPDVLYFEGIHLACLSGPNGAGKSSILDAITWAIWGKARARSDEELIHIGQDDMAVTLDFIQDGTLYRVIRQRKLGSVRKGGGRTSSGSLDLLGWVDDENTFRVISEPSMRQTEHKLVDLIGLDYETFINSAYLQQGRADAFTVQTPAHRKKILSEILNLGLWEAYEEQTKEYLRDIQAELNAITSRLEDIARDIAEEPAVRHEYGLAEAQLQEARELTQAAEESVREMAWVQSELSAATSERTQLEYQIRERDRELASTRPEIERYERQRDEFQVILEQREAIEEGYAKLMQAQEENQALGDQLRVLRDIEQRIHQLERQINDAQQAIEHEITSSETLMVDAQGQADTRDELRGRMEHTLAEIVLLEQDERRRDILLQEIADLREEDAALRAENDALKVEMDSIKQRLDLVKSIEDPTCPLCGQALDDDHRLRLQEEFQQEGQTRGDRFRANLKRIQDGRAEIQEREQSIQILAKRLPELNGLRGQLGSLEQQVVDSDTAQRRAYELEGHVQSLRQTIDNHDFAHELHQQLADALEEYNRLEYDPDLHDNIRDTVEIYRGYQDQSNALLRALDTVPMIEQSLQEAHARLARYQASKDTLVEQLAAAEGRIAELGVQMEEWRRRESEWTYRRTVERQALEKWTALQQRLYAIEGQRQRYQELETRSYDLQAQQNTYKHLQMAFSKNGIPAMIIESVIPELEIATNRLLARMSAGRLTVRFDTQREKKTGGVSETFDIWIADELGTRDYSLYSGGEAFRVNFALRIAISQLLARRAGAQLRTLFIDEGFGTQDDIGRERLVEAINAIQDDFDLILVITHIDDLRDAFPVRIEVEKLTDGSRVRIMG